MAKIFKLEVLKQMNSVGLGKDILYLYKMNTFKPTNLLDYFGFKLSKTLFYYKVWWCML